MKTYLCLFLAWRFSLVALYMFLTYLNRGQPVMFLTAFAALYLAIETLWVLKRHYNE